MVVNRLTLGGSIKVPFGNLSLVHPQNQSTLDGGLSTRLPSHALKMATSI